MDENIIKARVAARELAEEYVGLMLDECKSNIDLPSQDAFWEVIKKALPIMPRPKSKRESTAMTDAEARAFGDLRMEFGKFAGTRIDDVSLDYLEWYAEQPFQKQLQRYLNSRRIQSELS